MAQVRLASARCRGGAHEPLDPRAQIRADPALHAAELRTFADLRGCDPLARSRAISPAESALHPLSRPPFVLDVPDAHGCSLGIHQLDALAGLRPELGGPRRAGPDRI